MERGWDTEHGGLYYGMAPDGSICDDGKYHWVQAESMAATSGAVRTGDARYWQWYDRIWTHCWAHFVDHEHGAWFRILHRNNRNTTRDKSNAGKVDYHNWGRAMTCWGWWGWGLRRAKRQRVALSTEAHRIGTIRSSRIGNMEVGLLTPAQQEQMVDLLLALHDHYHPGCALDRAALCATTCWTTCADPTLRFW